MSRPQRHVWTESVVLNKHMYGGLKSALHPTMNIFGIISEHMYVFICTQYSLHGNTYTRVYKVEIKLVFLCFAFL